MGNGDERKEASDRGFTGLTARRHAPGLTRLLTFGAVAGVLLVGPASARAADPALLPKEEEVKKAKDEKKDQGWDPFIQIGASLALSGSSNTVGQLDGNSITGGLSLLGRLDFLCARWDWRNTLKIAEVFTRTPVVDEFIKSSDQLAFETILYWQVSEFVGPFLSAKLETTILEGTDVRAAPVDYTVAGTVIDAAKTHHKLSDAFQPLALKQAIGAYVRPINQKDIEVVAKAGFGAAETFAAGAEIVTDDATTAGAIELTKLEDVIQAGAVVGVEAKGTLQDGHVTYTTHAEVMFPFINDDPGKRGVGELTNVDIGAKIGFKIFDWASLDYEVKLLRQPQLVDAWQIQHSLLLTFAFTPVD